MSDTSGSAVLAPVSMLLGRPMPRADPGVVRAVAGRLAGVAGDWDRVRGVLAGRVGDGTGWAGCAELAFAESVAGEMAQLSLVVKRFDGYAAALTAYAGELEVLEPRLAAARSRLDSQSVADPVAAAQFESCWRDWDAARGRCVARLRAAGAGAGTGHRHWWSGLAGGLSHVVRHGMGLADWSRLLADLGQGLVVAGLVCALVCPPLAGAVWAAVAVVAVCQLAVDAARRERGEPVGWAGLGWDVVGALPAGRAARELRAAADAVTEWRSAAEASAAIERLPQSVRSSPLVPGGGLEAHEGTETVRGHTLRKHVGKTRKQLAERFKNEPFVRWSSSFTDRYTAEAAIAMALDRNRVAVHGWLAGSRLELRIAVNAGVDVGRSLARDGTIVNTSQVRVVLRREDTMLGYYIKTAYPTP